MNYAIIRNAKYTLNQLGLIYRHNERKNTNYSNKDINRNISGVNYSIKKCKTTYRKEFETIKKEFHLQGKIKNSSNVVCEYIITASPEFFEGLAETEIKRYFETAYKFVCGFKNLGEQYIISAKIHMDESNPHMHLVYIPVVHKKEPKSGKSIEKLCCSDFWKGKNSYKILQDNFYNYMTRAGFKLDRGNTEDNKHIKIADLKQVTNYEVQKYENELIKLEYEVPTDDIESIKENCKRIIRKYNTLAKQYTKIKIITESNTKEINKLTKENNELRQNNNEINKENSKLKSRISFLKHYIDKAIECVSIMFNFSKEKLKQVLDLYAKEDVGNEYDRRNK